VPSLPFLDLAQTLSNLDLTLEEYLPILAKTYESCYEDLFLPFERLVKGEAPMDKNQLAYYAHSLAGILGNLGSLELFKDLKACENWALDERSPPQGSEILKTCEKVKTFFLALEKVFNGTPLQPLTREEVS
jgi:hypothetical protein